MRFLFRRARPHQSHPICRVSLGFACSFVDKPRTRSAIKWGNARFKSCRAVISLLDSYEIPWILENPATSKCWYVPFVQNWVTCSHTHLVIADFCQYNRPWRKRTTFLCGNICSDDLRRLNHRCSGVRTCDRTGRPHFRLTKKGPGGKHWTAIAIPLNCVML